jgi:hypothetical protein
LDAKVQVLGKPRCEVFFFFFLVGLVGSRISAAGSPPRLHFWGAMAAAATMCRSVGPLEMRSGTRCVALDGWACQPSARCPVSAASAASSSGSSCTTEKGVPPPSEALAALDDADEACSRESRCVTPTSKEHRIPLVDVAACPPAPKKPRAHARLSFLRSADRDAPNLLQKLGFSPGYLS